MEFVTFMSSSTGRLLRVVVGLALIVLGLSLGGSGLVWVAVGLVPVAAGVGNFCLLAPLFGQHLRNH